MPLNLWFLSIEQDQPITLFLENSTPVRCHRLWEKGRLDPHQLPISSTFPTLCCYRIFLLHRNESNETVLQASDSEPANSAMYLLVKRCVSTAKGVVAVI